MPHSGELSALLRERTARAGQQLSTLASSSCGHAHGLQQPHQIKAGEWQRSPHTILQFGQDSLGRLASRGSIRCHHISKLQHQVECQKALTAFGPHPIPAAPSLGVSRARHAPGHKGPPLCPPPSWRRWKAQSQSGPGGDPSRLVRRLTKIACCKASTDQLAAGLSHDVAGGQVAVDDLLLVHGTKHSAHPLSNGVDGSSIQRSGEQMIL